VNRPREAPCFETLEPRVLYSADPVSGACCDGLQPLGLNRNQGAESTLAYLWTEWHSIATRQTSALLAAAATQAVGSGHRVTPPA
jgi:hypothetical protein